jgi:hypothetical protein
MPIEGCRPFVDDEAEEKFFFLLLHLKYEIQTI